MKIKGRRVKPKGGGKIRDLKKPGDYTVRHVGDEVESVWFWMPGYKGSPMEDTPLWNRITGPASPEPVRWKVQENDDGTITVDPSIKCSWMIKGQRYVFHAWLKNGVWEILSDSLGFGG